MDPSHRDSLRAYMEQRPQLGMLWIVTVLKDCSVEEFDKHVRELEPIYGRYLRWVDIPKIRGKIVSDQRSRDV